MNVTLLNKIRYLLVSGIEEIKEIFLNRSYLILVSMESSLYRFYFTGVTLVSIKIPKEQISLSHKVYKFERNSFRNKKNRQFLKGKIDNFIVTNGLI